MSWVCPTCSNTNDEGFTHCSVCEAARPTDISESRAAKESVIVFSTFAVIKESVKDFVGFFVRLGRGIKSLFKRIFTKKKKPRDGEESAEPPKRRKASRRAKKIAKPWPEDGIRLDADAIRSRGFVRVERAELNFVKGYKLFKDDGSSRFMRADMLVTFSMAKRE